MTEEVTPTNEQQNNEMTTVEVAKVVGKTFFGLGCFTLYGILWLVGTFPIIGIILFLWLFPLRIEIKFPRRYETQSNVYCAEEYTKRWGKWHLTGEISHFSFQLKDGEDKEAGIYAYEGDLYVRIKGVERRLVANGSLDRNAKVIEPDWNVEKEDAPEVKWRKWGYTLAEIILFFFNTRLKTIEGIPQAVLYLPLIAKPGERETARTFMLHLEHQKDTIEFSTDGESWHPLPFPRDRLEKIFGPLLDEEESNRRAELQTKKAEELKAQWKKAVDAIKQGKENVEKGKEKIDQGLDKGKAIFEQGRGLFRRNEGEVIPAATEKPEQPQD